MAIIDNSTNLINSIPFTDQSVAPTTPPAGERRVFTKSDGIYTVDSAGSVVGPLAAAAGASIGTDGWVSAGETWTYASADAPTFTFTVAADVTLKYSPGMRVKLTQTTVKYFIITAVSAYSAPNTTITVYGGTDYTLANAAISSNSYSVVKSPVGFPMSPAKWTVEFKDTSARSQASPTINTWYNLGTSTISVPIGVWRLAYWADFQLISAGATQYYAIVTLSTANNSESNKDFSVYISAYGGGELDSNVTRENVVTLAAKTSYYLNGLTQLSGMTTMLFSGSAATTIIRAVCAYL